MYLGIDLGTTHTSVGICEGAGEPAQAATLDTERFEPFHTVLRSQVWLPSVGSPVVGHRAALLHREPVGKRRVAGRLLASFKPLLSRPRLGRDIAVWEKVGESWSSHTEQNEPQYARRSRRVYGEWTRTDVIEATTALLEELEARLQKHHSVRFQDATRLVFGIPLVAGATHQRRVIAALSATRWGQALGPAGLLQRLRFVPEPVAAAWFAGMRPHTVAFADEMVVVCDSGGGTTDLALIRYVPGPGGRTLVPRVEMGLGGVGFAGNRLTERLKELVLADPLGRKQWDAFDKDQQITALYQVEEAKRDLSERDEVEVRLDPGRRGVVVKRSRFERAIRKEVEDFAAAARVMVDRAGADLRDVHRLFLVGGSSLVPAVQRAILACFPFVGPAHERRFDAARREDREAAITSVSAGLAAYAAVQDQERRAPANYFFLAAGDDRAEPQTSIEIGTQLEPTTPTEGRWVKAKLHRDASGHRSLSVGLYHDLLKPTYLFGVEEWPVPSGFGGAAAARVRAVLQPDTTVPEIEVADGKKRVVQRFSLAELIARDPRFLEEDREMWERPDRRRCRRRPLTKLIEVDDVLVDLRSEDREVRVSRVRPLARHAAPMVKFQTHEYSFRINPTKKGRIDTTIEQEIHQPPFGVLVHPGDSE